MNALESSSSSSMDSLSSVEDRFSQEFENFVDSALFAICQEDLGTEKLELGMKLEDLLQQTGLDCSRLFKYISEGESYFAHKIDFTSSGAKTVFTEILKEIGSVHWLAFAFLAIGYGLEKYQDISANDKECIDLFKVMFSFAKFLKQLNCSSFNEDIYMQQKMLEAVSLIINGVILCGYVIRVLKTFKWVCTGIIREKLADLRGKIDRMKTDLGLQMLLHIAISECDAMISPSETRRRKESFNIADSSMNACEDYMPYHRLLDWKMQQLPMEFTATEIYNATEEFKDVIRDTGFAVIYKGTLTTGKQVAIKKYWKQNEELRSELEYLQLHLNHFNILKFVGSCVERSNAVLVYDYMPYSLVDFISHTGVVRKSTDSQLLDWRTRYKILLGLTGGLSYLHEGVDVSIVHRNIKPSSILLDENFNAKISNFGLAVALPHPEDTPALRNVKLADIWKKQAVAGTIGYIAPEYFLGGPVTAQGDIYSLGIVALELISGTRGFRYTDDEMEFIPGLASRLHREDHLVDLIDTGLVNSQEYDSKSILRTIMIALWCIQSDPKVRPPASRVLAMLSTDCEIPPHQKNYQQKG